MCRAEQDTEHWSTLVALKWTSKEKEKQSTKLYNFSSVKDSINFHFKINFGCYSLQKEGECILSKFSGGQKISLSQE